MLDAIKAFFSDKIISRRDLAPSDHQLHLATAAVLLEVGIADFEIAEEELVEIASALKNQFNFSAAETEQLLQLAIKEHQEHSSMHPFLRLINENFSLQQKCDIVEDMWKVAYADERLDKYEEYRIRKIANLLYVPHKDFIRAKLRVQGKTR